MIGFVCADIPEHWTDISKKIINDAKNLPSEIGDTAKFMKDIDNEIHNIRVNLHNINIFIDKLRYGYEGIIEFLNTPFYEIVESINLPITYLSVTVGALLLMFGLHRWGSKLCKFGLVWFFTAQLVVVVARGFA